MHRTTRPAASVSEDIDGRVIVLVPVPYPGAVPAGNFRWVKLFPSDYHRMGNNVGPIDQWHATRDGRGSYRIKPDLARLIMRARDGQRVTYKDGDPFNLRADNLELEGGTNEP